MCPIYSPQFFQGPRPLSLSLSPTHLAQNCSQSKREYKAAILKVAMQVTYARPSTAFAPSNTPLQLSVPKITAFKVLLNRTRSTAALESVCVGGGGGNFKNRGPNPGQATALYCTSSVQQARSVGRGGE